MEFNFEIGTVPPGWSRDCGAPRIINGDFKHGPMAAISPGMAIPLSCDFAPDTLCAYTFHYDQRHKVKAWIDWFMTEYDE